MTKLSNILATRDNKGKIRIASISMDRIETDAGDLYVIHRSTGLNGGKQVQGPDIEIFKGKAKRTLEEQATLQYNALVKEYKDKGYKKVDVSKSLEEQVPATKQDANNAVKPMLCKAIDFEDKKLLGVQWLASRKHDGVKALFFLRDGKVVTSSRGGQDYDIPATYLREDPTIKRLLQENPGMILDGEIYRHGWPLEKISGLCRQITLSEEHKELKFHCYDIVDETMTFKDRYATQQKWEIPADSRLVVVEQIPIGPFTDIPTFKKKVMELHDKFIGEGYEGAVIKDSSATYKCGARDRRSQKIKLFKDAEYKITGLSEGLREEDMSFELITAEGYPFKAKPEGSRELKHWYHEHIDEMIGHWGTVRYFHMSNTEHPVPNLPVFVNWRLEKDM